jgi:hypothetical protein
MRIVANIILVALSIVNAAVVGHAQAPDNTFRKASGQMYCEAPHGGQGCHSRGRLTISIEPGYVIDRSYHQGSIPCCSGAENGNGASTEIPGGVYMQFNGGQYGEWGVFGIKLSADSNDVDDNGNVRAWTITADDVYCGPSAAVGTGGCNVNAYAWVKVKRVN